MEATITLHRAARIEVKEMGVVASAGSSHRWLQFTFFDKDGHKTGDMGVFSDGTSCPVLVTSEMLPVISTVRSVEAV